MTLVHHRYGKGRVRVLRVHRDGDRHEVRELTVSAMMEGNFGRAFTDKDNSLCVSTDTVKNVVNVVSRRNLALDTEDFCKAVAAELLTYEQVDTALVSAHETKWLRYEVDGMPHPHGFVVDANGKPFADVVAKRDGSISLSSGLDGFTFMKTTESGWDNYFKDKYTTIKETRDRIAATSMAASWKWTAAPASYTAANALILKTMLDVFVTTYSDSVQDSLYRMGTAALAAVPEISEITMACPNKHYLLINLEPFGLDNKNQVFVPTDEPHGQIECTVGR